MTRYYQYTSTCVEYHKTPTNNTKTVQGYTI